MAKDTAPAIYAKGLRGWEPASATAEAEFRAAPLHKRVRMKVSMPRNLSRLGLYWATAATAAENMEEYEDADSLHLATKIELGFCKLVPPIRKGGQWGYKDGSIAFDKMPEHQFKEFVDAAFALWAARLECSVDELTSAGREAA